MKIKLFVHKIHQFEPDTGRNTQDPCDAVTKISTQNTPLVFGK